MTAVRAGSRAVALLAAAVAGHRDEIARREELFASAAARGRPHLEEATGTTVALREGGSRYEAVVRQVDVDRFLVRVNGTEVEGLAAPGALVTSAGSWDIQIHPDGEAFDVWVAGEQVRVRRDDTGVVRSPSPAVVSAIFVRPGDAVSAGDALMVIEAMKMEMTVTAPVAGVVAQVAADVNGQVDAGAALLRIGAGAEGEREPALPVVDLSVLGPPTPEVRPPCRAALLHLRRFLLGYDVEAPAASAGAVAARCAAPSDHPRHEAEVTEVLLRYADICSLVRPERADDQDLETEAGPLGGEAALFTYLRAPGESDERLPRSFRSALGRVLEAHGASLGEDPAVLRGALMRVFRAGQRLEELTPAVTSLLDQALVTEGLDGPHPALRGLLDRIVAGTRVRMPAVSDLAREARFRLFDRPELDRRRARVAEELDAHLDAVEADPGRADRDERIEALVAAPLPLRGAVGRRLPGASEPARGALLEVLARRYYRIRDLEGIDAAGFGGHTVVSANYRLDGRDVRLLLTHATLDALGEAFDAIAEAALTAPPGSEVVVDVFAWAGSLPRDADGLSDEVATLLDKAGFDRPPHRVVVVVSGPEPDPARYFTFRPALEGEGYVEERLYRGLHPMFGKRLELWRLVNFDVRRLPSVEDVYLFHAVARDNPNDQRLVVLAEVRDVTSVTDEAGLIVAMPELERMLTESLEAIRMYQSHQPMRARLHWNRVLLYIRPPIEVPPEGIVSLVGRLAPLTEGLGLEKVVVRGSIRDPGSGEFVERVLHLSNPAGRGLVLRMDLPANEPIPTLSPYSQKVVQMRRRGLVYPYEIVRILTPPPEGARADLPSGTFTELDLDDVGELVPVDRPWGHNAANVVVGLVTNTAEAYPEGMTRVVVLGDPSRALGSLAEPECRRIIAALDLAERLGVPLEWFAVSAGAKISMESGTENMDWIARVLRRLIIFTQAGCEVNVVVVNINVGAQPYWNAEATMLMHTKGVLIMCADGAMVLTGKQALDYSGGVSAEDNLGIGGYDRVMGPNGQAQYWARDVEEACRILHRHYARTYVAPGERFPRRVVTTDPLDRDVRSSAHQGDGFRTVGEVFSHETNSGRKKPFDIRSVMRAAADADREPLERWMGMRDAETVVVWDAHLGGRPVCMLGIESHPIARRPPVPADGPEQWTAGTLFPLSSKKAARAINAASDRRPLVVLANLSGFDGAPESLRNLQLEFGAEIGRAIVNFRGPIVFLVVTRYHGGAFVVFSATLNESMEVAAVEGSYASVIGGAPAAAVVFAKEVDARTDGDPRVSSLAAAVETAEEPERARLRAELDRTRRAVRSEKLGEVADEFDHVHDIHRAVRTGSVHRIIPADQIRPYLIDAVERGIARELERP